MRSEVYELPSWRDPPLWAVPVAVRTVLGDFAKDLGHVPETLDAERAVCCFAGSCGLPLTDLDIEADIFDAVPSHPRFVSRSWVREQYGPFLAWCREQGWVDAANLRRAGESSERPADEPVAVESEPVAVKKKRRPVAA